MLVQFKSIFMNHIINRNQKSCLFTPNVNMNPNPKFMQDSYCYHPFIQSQTRTHINNFQIDHTYPSTHHPHHRTRENRTIG